MKKTLTLIIIIATIVIIAPVSYAQGTHSGQASRNAGQASGAASKSAVHSVAASAQIASAIIAVPLVAIGAVGSVSTHVGEELWDAATSDFSAPLEISDEIVTAGPSPEKAVMKSQDL